MNTSSTGAFVKTPPKLVRFGHVNHFKSRPKIPPVSLLSLKETRSHLQDNSIAPSTKRGYKTAMNHWADFTSVYAFPSTPSSDSLSLFVTHLYRLDIGGIDKILSGLANHFKGRMDHWDKIRSHYSVLTALKGAARLSTKITKRSPPLLPSHLSSFLAAAIAPNSTHDDLLACFMATVGFGALLRLGEMVEPPRKEDRDPRKYVKRDSARFVNDDEFHFHLPYHKADRLYRGSAVVIVSATSTSYDFVRLAKAYVASRDRQPRCRSSPYLFLRSNGSLPTRRWFMDRLKAVEPTVTGHALRAGGATFLAKLGLPFHIIQRLGRWSSAAFEIYIREHPSISAALLLSDRRASPESLRRRQVIDNALR